MKVGSDWTASVHTNIWLAACKFWQYVYYEAAIIIEAGCISLPLHPALAGGVTPYNAGSRAHLFHVIKYNTILRFVGWQLL